MKKIKVGIVFGGRSGEHEVSLSSAESVLKAINKEKYEVFLIGITKQGQWITAKDPLALLKSRADHDDAVPVALIGEPLGKQLISISDKRKKIEKVDVFFPILHGPYGEDGTIQGLFELANVPYVGAGVAGSAIGLDKDLMKRIFISENLPVVKYISFKRSEWEKDHNRFTSKVGTEIGYPCFIKPANAGSSIGVSKVSDFSKLDEAIHLATKFDSKIIAEAAVNTREIECSVLGNDDPKASILGEVVPAHEFYDYDAKYHNENSELIIPAKISGDKTREMQDIAVRAFKAMECAGMARVDFFLEKETDRVFLNEVNTIPGFTKISMYPKLWDASGLSYPDLIDKLIMLAIERHQEKNRNITSYK